MKSTILHHLSTARRRALAGAVGFDRWAEQKVYERAARADADRLAEIERFCLFVGFPRSGGSLVGAMLDAHPDMAIAQELGALRKVRFGTSKTALYAALLKADRKFADRGSQHEDFDYRIPGQWQGRFRRLVVIGDKHAENSSDQLIGDPTLIDQLRATIGVPVRLVVVIRHPLDNIARIARRGDGHVLGAVARYGDLARAVERALAEAGDGALIVYHEDTVADPPGALRRMAAFLEVEAPDDWVESCAALVLPSPRLARTSVEWSPGERLLVDELIARYGFLQRYAPG